MSIIFSFIALALVTAIISVYLKHSGFPSAALIVSLCGGVLILLRAIPYLSELFLTITEVADTAGLRTDYLGLVIKVVCIAYIGEFAAQICRDVGENSLAEKADLGTKLVIMVMAMPLLKTILATVLDVFH